MEWTGARYADQPTVEATIWISGGPERVWPLVSDIRLMPSMSQELQSAEWCDGASGPGLGHAFLGRSKHDALGEWQTKSYVVEYEQPRVFAWAVGDRDNPASTWRFTLEPERGGTRLVQWARLGPARSGLSYAIDRRPDQEQKIVFVRLREWEKAMTATVAAVKDRVEAGR
ncbi:SRPBCC family protein [Amycolatopsis sp. PS_44_ISF1]|uniref:SRPBCC family protein n=1 Tax=Amycolatopsis sp. PS_44_ISF1 TaxID=2974917 RepID=UPI0028DEBA84|nr:SRPBCC family protein [Amycolatopsis sp. PS_44_ISF1]MDT8911768.1 SRPBCC family protein [Amycolatopsis sp. PS_44_ISF1]